MTKKSYFFIFIIVSCFTFLAAWRGYQYYSAYTEKVNARAMQEAKPLFSKISSGTAGQAPQSTFTPLPVTQDDLSMKPLGKNSQVVIADKENTEEPHSTVYNDPNPILPRVTKNEELQTQAVNVFAKYSNRPVVQAFNRDLRQAGLHNLDFSNLNGPEFAKRIQSDPQIQMLVIKYAQNPEFLAVIQEMAQDQEVQKVTTKLRQNMK